MGAIQPLYRAGSRALVLEPDLRGKPLLDATGRRIGRVHDVWVEAHPIEEAGILGPKVSLRYLEVRSDRSFPRAQSQVILPIDNVTIEAGGVQISASRWDLFG